MLEERPERGTREQQEAGAEEEEAEDERSRTAEQAAEDGLEPFADRTSVLRAEQNHRPHPDEDEPGAERLHVDERSTGDQQQAEPEQEERDADSRRPHERIEGIVDLPPDEPARPVQPDDDREEDADREEAEPEQLVVLAAARPARALRLPDARRRLRARGNRALLPRHGSHFAGRSSPPATQPLVFHTHKVERPLKRGNRHAWDRQTPVGSPKEALVPVEHKRV